MAEDTASSENEVEQQVSLQPPIVGGTNRILAAQAQLTERQAKFMFWHNTREMAQDSLKGAARNWREALERQLTAPLPGVVPSVPQVVTWERFVKGFNDQYCSESYALEQEIAFTRLEQGTMTVPEYEARFATLSRYAPDFVVGSDAKKCNRFWLGLSPNVAK
ncbi:hypothetical protein Vadar_009288 [Vaccinium darrowii]|uniref:Uncharacterized protein n=1 Tax=Vaccinium darrowii TaxID=229202 RepID=A0ACB7WZ14_9ERIC|nr:hypothetical protein Vadar_009288 [Vaccinium darrowii]